MKTKKHKMLLITTIPLSFVFFERQIRYLKKVFDIQLVSSEGEYLYHYAAIEGVNYHIVNTKREISFFNDILSLLNYIRLFRRLRPDMIHCNTPKGAFLSLIAGTITRVPTRIYMIHGARYEGSTGIKRKVLIYAEKVACHLATDVMAVGRGVQETFNREVTNKSIEVVGNGSINGIDLAVPTYDKTEIIKTLNIEPNDFVFGFVGRLVRDKGIVELVTAFTSIAKTYENVKLLLVGGYEADLDPLPEAIITEIKTHPKIVTLGFQKDVKKFYPLMNIFVFPSYREGLAGVLLETARAKIPVISSNIAGCNEIVEDGVTGWLVEKKSVEMLEKQMRWASQNEAQLKEMGERAYLNVAERFDHTVVRELYLEKYKNIVEQRKGEL